MKYLLPFLLLLSFNANAAPLTGEPPIQRADDSVFDVANELAGFNVRCGIIKGEYTNTTYFEGFTLPITTWEVPLPTGVHYCVVTSIDTDGRESIYSNEVTVTVDGNYAPKEPNVVETIINIVITLPKPN